MFRGGLGERTIEFVVKESLRNGCGRDSTGPGNSTRESFGTGKGNLVSRIKLHKHINKLLYVEKRDCRSTIVLGIESKKY